MASDTNSWFEDSIQTLTYNRNQRVWSIIVSLFGDLARAPGDRISGSQLSRITEPMAIKPEAVRVALHRLRNDGWIASEKSGRSSFYHLTQSGLVQSEAASPRIYTRDVIYPDVWHLCIPEPLRKSERDEQARIMRREGYVSVAQGVYLGPEVAPKRDDCLTISGDLGVLPRWLKQQISPPQSVKAYEDLEQALDRFAQILENAPTPTPLEVATLRTIIVHVWRRALFSHPDLPDAFFPEGWRGTACRHKVMDALDRLGLPGLDSLSA
ncbi:transcriptional regulator, PaaX family [Shimia gijangensis]|uniref:Transcriptional regulator, PaaX family n=1 Tax=Shimia gijangensis TaxID=1470563 RepID=A0A1M6K8U0_9RHOB|nr:PaaX family transcriptional regulator C-terminal domain-containing protein [Shimia gijangensis]SHJ55372.1 transcriptional regulator, PaaX family [Shimia gijangensis]